MNRYLTTVFVLFSLLLTGSASWAQPKIEFVVEERDFGFAAPMSALHHNFEFKNAGNQPLVIYDVHSTCGCTAAVLSATTIPAGATNIIAVTMTTSTTPDMMKHVTVASNDPSNPNVTLTVRARVKEVWSWEPRNSFAFGEVSYSSHKSETLFLKNNENPNSKIVSTSISRPEFTAEIGQPTENGTPITVTANSTNKEEHLADMLQLRTDDPNQPIVRIPVSMQVVGPVRFSQPRLFFGSVPKGNTTTREVIVSIPDEAMKEKFEITGIQAEPDLVKGEVLEKRPDHSIRLRFTFNADQTPGFKRGEVILKTSLDIAPEVRYHYSAIIR